VDVGSSIMRSHVVVYEVHDMTWVCTAVGFIDGFCSHRRKVSYAGCDVVVGYALNISILQPSDVSMISEQCTPEYGISPREQQPSFQQHGQGSG
jgi:hypothetical protein